MDIDYLNQIAKSEKLITPLGQYIFNLQSYDDFDAYIDNHYLILCSEGYDSSVASRVLELLPFVLENEAISKYSLKNNASQLRNSMPVILDANEALIYAKGDSMSIMLDDELQKQFLFLMNELIAQQKFLSKQTI